jgi:predicted HTH domain antitoxin
MIIEIDDDIAQKCNLDAQEALQLLAIAIYKAKGIHGTLAGKILGISELEFHQLLSKQGQSVNYGLDDLIADIKTNDL